MVIALTGKCCSGKNYVSSLFEKKGFNIIDVDFISHNVFNSQRNKIDKTFGTCDRKELGEIIFSDPVKRDLLESMIHPKVYDEIYSNLDKEGDTVINIPLLKSDKLVKRCDLILWITSPFILRFFRALTRDNYSVTTVIKRIISQWKLNVKHFYWDVDIKSIRNGFRLQKVDKEVDNLLKKLGRG